MEKALKVFDEFINSDFKRFYEVLQSKKFPITLAIQVKSDLLYLPLSTLGELKEKDSVAEDTFYRDINCNRLVELDEPLIITKKNLNVTTAVKSRIVADYLINSFGNSADLEDCYIDEWTLKLFFSRESCTPEEAAYILVGAGPVIPRRVISEDDCTKHIFNFLELKERVVKRISSGYYDEMDINSIFDETAELSGNVFKNKILYQIANLCMLFKTWTVKHPLYMANEFCKMGVNHKNFSTYEQLIIKILNDRKNIYPELFKKEFPFLSEFLEKNEEPQEIIAGPIEQYLSKVGGKGGKKLKEKKELRLLVQHELEKGLTWTTFKAMLDKKHTQEINAYEGIEGVCDSIYITDEFMYYSTDTQEEEQKISIYTLKRYFSDERKKIKENSELISSI